MVSFPSPNFIFPLFLFSPIILNSFHPKSWAMRLVTMHYEGHKWNKNKYHTSHWFLGQDQRRFNSVLKYAHTDIDYLCLDLENNLNVNFELQLKVGENITSLFLDLFLVLGMEADPIKRQLILGWGNTQWAAWCGAVQVAADLALGTSQIRLRHRSRALRPGLQLWDWWQE